MFSPLPGLHVSGRCHKVTSEYWWRMALDQRRLFSCKNQTMPTLDFSCYNVDKFQVFKQKLLWWDIYFSIKGISLEEAQQPTRHMLNQQLQQKIALCSFTNQNILSFCCFPMVFLPGTNLLNVTVLYFSHNNALKPYNDLINQLKWRV